ncbi:hypothetical protein V1503_24470 [Bacillus sp. SCS-151]|uniref:hypothetical protein n=1 Tax=Nanhaiella sioensis TaxID=3115293 RepID=UPI0039785203
MRYLLKFYNLYISIGLLISIVIIAITQFIWKDTPEFYSWGSELGEILYACSLSYVVSYIFYMIVTYLPDKYSKWILRDKINKKIRDIHKENELMLKELQKIANHQLGNSVSYPEIELLMSKIDPYVIIPLKRNSTAMIKCVDFLYQSKENTKVYIDEVLKLNRYIDVEVVEILLDIKTCTYFMILEALKNTSTVINSTGLNTLKSMNVTEDFYNYIKLLNELDKKIK